MNKTIEITFAPSGQLTIEAHGFKGFCHQATRDFEEALGEVQDRRRTAEFFQTENTKTQQKTGQ